MERVTLTIVKGLVMCKGKANQDIVKWFGAAGIKVDLSGKEGAWLKAKPPFTTASLPLPSPMVTSFS